jgi:hypothetical protein
MKPTQKQCEDTTAASTVMNKELLQLDQAGKERKTRSGLGGRTLAHRDRRLLTQASATLLEHLHLSPHNNTASPDF